MITIAVEIRTADFEATLKDFSERMGIALPKVVKVESRLLMAEVIKWTPPFDGGHASTEGIEARNIGKQSVANDIRRAIYPLIESEWYKPEIKQAIAAMNKEKMATVLKRSRGRAKNPTFEPVSKANHKKFRDSRGRVQRPSGVFTFAVNTHAEYTRKMQTRVGMAKGSWAAAYTAAGGKMPAWMMKAAAQSGGQSSTFFNNLDDPVSPSMEITSTALGVRGNNKLKSQINFALNLRSKAMASKFKRMLSDPIKYKNLYEQYNK